MEPINPNDYTLVGYVVYVTHDGKQFDQGLIACLKRVDTNPTALGQNAQYAYYTTNGQQFPTLLRACRNSHGHQQAYHQFINLACCIPSCSCHGLGVSV